MRTYEEDWDTPGFKKSNRIAWKYRGQEYSAPRPTFEDIPKFDESLKGGYKAFYEMLLSKRDLDRFWAAFNDADNPGKPETLLKMTKDLYADLNGTLGLNGEEDPKDGKSSTTD